MTKPEDEMKDKNPVPRIELPTDFYMATRTFGGESLWIETIASHFNKTVSYIWPRGKRTPDLPIEGLRNKILVFISTVLPSGRGLFMNILIAHYRFPKGRRALISTPYYPIPKNTYIAYIHTPSRLLTVEFKSIENKGIVKKLAWKLFRSFYKKTYCHSLNNAEKVYANSEFIKERIDKLCGVNTGLPVAYPFLNTSEFICSPSENYFFLPSRFTEQKNQKFAIEAFKILLERVDEIDADRKDVKLILAGSSPENSGSQESYLRELLEMAEVTNKNAGDRIQVILDADRSKLIDLYSRSYAVLYTAIQEDFGYVPIEGMASGKPVIAIDQGGIRESVLDGKNGYLVRNPVEMAEKMLLLLGDPEFAFKLGKYGKDHVERYELANFLTAVGIGHP